MGKTPEEIKAYDHQKYLERKAREAAMDPELLAIKKQRANKTSANSRRKAKDEGRYHSARAETVVPATANANTDHSAYLNTMLQLGGKVADLAPKIADKVVEVGDKTSKTYLQLSQSQQPTQVGNAQPPQPPVETADDTPELGDERQETEDAREESIDERQPEESRHEDPQVEESRESEDSVEEGEVVEPPLVDQPVVAEQPVLQQPSVPFQPPNYPPPQPCQHEDELGWDGVLGLITRTVEYELLYTIWGADVKGLGKKLGQVTGKLYYYLRNDVARRVIDYMDDLNEACIQRRHYSRVPSWVVADILEKFSYVFFHLTGGNEIHVHYMTKEEFSAMRYENASLRRENGRLLDTVERRDRELDAAYRQLDEESSTSNKRRRGNTGQWFQNGSRGGYNHRGHYHGRQRLGASVGVS